MHRRIPIEGRDVIMRQTASADRHASLMSSSLKVFAA